MLEFLEYGYIGLFAVCFLSATLIPLPSEFALIYFISIGANPWVILAIASLGNSLGGATTYLIGKLFNNWKAIPKTHKSYALVNKYGIYAALFSWVPIIGDPILLLLGYYRTQIWSTLLLMALGKTARYAVICWTLA